MLNRSVLLRPYIAYAAKKRVYVHLMIDCFCSVLVLSNVSCSGRCLANVCMSTMR